MLEKLNLLRGHGPVELLRDALDIFLVYYLAYRALLVLKGTRAMQIGVGLAVIFLVYGAAQALRLITVLSIMNTLLSSMILIIVVVFQNDIRRGLQRVGSRAWLGGLHRSQQAQVIDEVVEAATELARHRIGALIAFEQEANLDEFVGVHKGHPIDAQVSRELLVSLFVPESMNKLHDGAVVIRNLRVAKAGVFFPMPEARVSDESFGSRHRAALGITEETDAVIVIVSEERGTISFCFNGNIASNLDGARLHSMLETIFGPTPRREPRRGRIDFGKFAHALQNLFTPAERGRRSRASFPPLVAAAVEPDSDAHEPSVHSVHPATPSAASAQRFPLLTEVDTPSLRARAAVPSPPPEPLRPTVTGSSASFNTATGSVVPPGASEGRALTPATKRENGNEDSSKSQRTEGS